MGPLDPESIEKRDFPRIRRGYEPEAVDAHLAALAREVQSLQRSVQRHASGPFAEAAAERVRAILNVAEASAKDLDRAAEEQAAQLNTEAERAAARTREEAISQAGDFVSRLSTAASAALAQVDAVERELAGFFETVRQRANRLATDLSVLESDLDALYDAAGARRSSSAEEVAAEVVEEPEPKPAPAPGAERGPDEIEAPAATADETEAARLVAQNLALSGQSRADADRYLADHFSLPDRQRLLDEIYSPVRS